MQYTVWQQKPAIYKRNYWFLVLEGAFFTASTYFYNTSTVIPVFIHSITGSKQLVGFTLTLGSVLMYLFRLCIGPFVPYIKNHVRFVTLIMFLVRPLLLIPPIFIFTGQGRLSVIMLIIVYGLFWASDGIIVPVWSEILANTIDENKHGRILGWQMFLGGLAGIGAGFMINAFLSNPSFHTILAYGWVFLAGGICSTLSCVMMAFARNSPQPYKTGKVNIMAYFRGLPRYLKVERDCAKMMHVQFLFLAASMCNPFFILFSRENLAIPQNSIAKLILIQLIGAPVGGWLWGIICDRYGPHKAIRLVSFNILLPIILSLLPLIFKVIPPMFFMAPVLFLVGVGSGTWTSYYVYTIQVVRPESRTACIVLTSVITLPTCFAGYLAGYISEKMGFVPLFIICIALVLTGMTLAFRLRSVDSVRESQSWHLG